MDSLTKKLFAGGCQKIQENKYVFLHSLAKETQILYSKHIDMFLENYELSENNLHSYLATIKSVVNYNTAKASLLKLFDYYSIPIAKRPKSKATQKQQRKIVFDTEDVSAIIDTEPENNYKKMYWVMYKYLLRPHSLLSMQVIDNKVFCKFKKQEDLQPCNVSIEDYLACMPLPSDSSTLRKRIAICRKEANITGFSLMDFRNVGIQDLKKEGYTLEQIKKVSKHITFDGLNYYTKK